MNNYEKAMSGYVFKRGNEVLAEKRMRAKDLCFRYNSLLPSDTENRAATMDEMLGRKGENCLIISVFQITLIFGSIRCFKSFYKARNSRVLWEHL